MNFSLMETFSNTPRNPSPSGLSSHSGDTWQESPWILHPAYSWQPTTPAKLQVLYKAPLSSQYLTDLWREVQAQWKFAELRSEWGDEGMSKHNEVFWHTVMYLMFIAHFLILHVGWVYIYLFLRWQMVASVRISQVDCERTNNLYNGSLYKEALCEVLL